MPLINTVASVATSFRIFLTISPAAEIEDEDSLDAEFQNEEILPLIEHPIGEEPPVAVQLEQLP
jgi:hypothetical protein